MTLVIAAQNTYSNNSGSVSSHPVNLPTGISAGDLLLVFAAFHGTPTVTDPSGWTALVSKVNTDTYRIYAKIADGSEGSTVTVGLSGSARSSAVSYRITGARNGVTSSEIAVSSAVDGNSATPDPPSLTPSWGSAENYWIAVTFSADGNFTFSSYPTNYADGQQNVQTGSGTGNAVTIAARLLTGSSEDPGVFTTVTGRTRSTYTLAIRPGAAAYTLSADPGSYALTGSAASLKHGFKISAGTGSYALTGTAATLRHAWITSAAAGSYALTGSTAALKLGRKVAATAGSYALTGTAAGLKRAGKTPAAAGSYSMSGTAAGVLHGWKVSATAGAYALTGTAATLRHGWRVTAAAGSYTLTGTAANLSKSITGKSIVAGVGSYALTGTAATLRHAWVAAAAAGSYALTGVAATLTKATSAKSVTADAGTYSLTGTDATLVKSQAKSDIITGGAGYWPEHKPKYRVHPEYDDTPAPKPKRKVKKVGPQIIIEGDPVIQTGIIEARPAWDALVELQQMRDAAEAERIRKLKALLLADDEWLMSA